VKFISDLNRRQRSALFRIIISAVLVAALLFIPLENSYLRLILFSVPYLIIGYDILFGALLGIKNLKPFDENFLMSIATVGAFILGDFTEAVAVMLFYQIGEFFQSYAIGKSRKNISALMDICPDTPKVVDEKGNIIEVDPYTVEIGTLITVRPGERIPIDGVIVSGNTHLDSSSLTGESLPVDAAKGSEVMSGCINLSSLITIRTTKLFSNSTAVRILELVENASGAKSRSERFISKFSRIYTPAVCIFALFLALGIPLFNLILGANPNLSVWIYRALTFLVISCPCALVISIPLSFFAGIGTASKQGILIKGSTFLETLSKIKYIVFDKTGTLTIGAFQITEIHSKIGEEKLLRLCALAESSSTHPIARCISSAVPDLDLKAVSELTELRGEGVTALIKGENIAVGNARLMERLGVPCPVAKESDTTVFVAINGEYVGHILVNDTLKPTSIKAIEELKKRGINNIVMLTGDKKGVATAIAEKLGIEQYSAELLPEDKVKKTEELLQGLKQGEKLAFVGDGINDAPVLMRADIGIAMGAIGSDAAIEAADVVLTDDDPQKIPKAIAIAKKCMAIVYENIYFAIGIKLVCLVLGAAGIANMWSAVFADVGVMILAVLNSLRIMKG